MAIATVPERITSTYLLTLPKKLVVGWAADVAEHVLARFEEACPADQRPRLAIAAARDWAAGKASPAEARKAADAAADAAYAAADAAYAAYAAADAAYAAAYACSDAACSAAAYAAYAAAYAAYAAAYAAYAAYAAGRASERASERAWQRNRLIQLMGA